jgi:hypothetical protein
MRKLQREKNEFANPNFESLGEKEELWMAYLL